MPAAAAAAATARASRVLPWLLLAASLLADAAAPAQHSLLTSAAAWLCLCVFATLRLRHTPQRGASSWLAPAPAQRRSWAAGVLLALARLCERAADGTGIWWAKALVPAVLHALVPAVLHAVVQGGVAESASRDRSPSDPTSPPRSGAAPRPQASTATLAVLTLSGLVAVSSHARSVTAVALGCSCAVLDGLAYHLVESIGHVSSLPGQHGGAVICSANALLAQPASARPSDDASWVSALRDVSAAGALTTGVAAICLEKLRFGGLAYYGLIGQAMGSHWVWGQSIVSLLYALATVLVHIVTLGALVLVIQRQSASFASLIPLSAAVCSGLLRLFSLSRLWFAVLCTCSIVSFLGEQDALSGGPRLRMRYGRILSLAAFTSFAVLLVYHLHPPLRSAAFDLPNPTQEPAIPVPPNEALRPLAYGDATIHPVKRLIHDAQISWNAKIQSQSQTLEAAVAEYRRRYGIPPPPGFDKWYDFAKRRDTQLIDDYDTIYHSLLPFWGLSPATIRQRAREALGFGDNMLMGVLIRDGKTVHVEGGPDWLQQATVGMMESFVESLPDLDLPFNTHDEPRVVVPHDELSRLIDIALTQNIPAAQSQRTPRNSFAKSPKDMNYKKRIPEAKTTRFNAFAHQPTWIPSRLSCPADSPARALEADLAQDNMTAYALGDLGFVYNQTAFSDICNTPSYGESHGFFDRPNAFNVVHELFPVFSQSKMSSFHDILFPSPWYWFGKVDYKEGFDVAWEKKANKLWWRGSTTGGFSRNGGWRRQHRQKFVAKINALDTARVLESSKSAATDKDGDWVAKEVPRTDFQDLIDVHFSHIGQCDPGDCDAQREYFGVADAVEQHEAWKWKYLLDMDGNAFSGRFYAFLESKSLPLKMAVFREWHEDWIKPWLHYIPLSLKADEALEVVRYLDAEEEGKPLAAAVAHAGSAWARKALRNEDFEVWFFRLLLEYARLVDDDRDQIGYSGA